MLSRTRVALIALVVALPTATAITAAAPTQRVTVSTPRVTLTDDSAFVTARCTASNADTVRLSWAYPTQSRTVALRPAACVDEFRIPRGSTAQALTATFLPKRRSVSGGAVTRSITIPARVLVLPPTIDSATIDTTTTPPVVTPPTDTVVTPPPSGSNEPSGMSVLVERPFAVKGEGFNDQGTAGTDYVFEQDPTAPGSPPNVVKQIFQAGYPAGDSPANFGRTFPARRTVYVRYYVKLSSNWQGHGSLVNKQLFIWSNGQPTVYVNARGSGSGTLQPEVRIQSGFALSMGPNVAPNAVFTRGEWHKWEIVLVGNTAGASDGSCEFWLDGVKVGSYPNIRFASGAATFDVVEYAPIWGGVGGSLSVTQYNWMDHLYISGK
jgi:hypothetical protein